MNIVVDTNILMSIFITPKGVIAELFEEVLQKNELYLSEYSFIELTKHSNKLLKASSLTSESFENAKVLLLKKLSIIPSHFISNEILIEAYQLTKDIDENDTIFIATAMFVNGILWTGDNVLYKGLQKKNFMGISNTNGIRAILLQ